MKKTTNERIRKIIAVLSVFALLATQFQGVFTNTATAAQDIVTGPPYYEENAPEMYIETYWFESGQSPIFKTDDFEIGNKITVKIKVKNLADYMQHPVLSANVHLKYDSKYLLNNDFALIEEGWQEGGLAHDTQYDITANAGNKAHLYGEDKMLKKKNDGTENNYKVSRYTDNGYETGSLRIINFSAGWESLAYSAETVQDKESEFEIFSANFTIKAAPDNNKLPIEIMPNPVGSNQTTIMFSSVAGEVKAKTARSYSYKYNYNYDELNRDNAPLSDLDIPVSTIGAGTYTMVGTSSDATAPKKFNYIKPAILKYSVSELSSLNGLMIKETDSQYATIDPVFDSKVWDYEINTRRAEFGVSAHINKADTRITFYNNIADREIQSKTAWGNTSSGDSYALTDTKSTTNGVEAGLECPVTGVGKENPESTIYVRAYSHSDSYRANITSIKIVRNYDVNFNENYVDAPEMPALSEFFTVHDTALNKLPTPPTRTGYTFAGWWTADGTEGAWGTEFKADTVVTDEMTVYAKWTGNPVTLPTATLSSGTVDAEYAAQQLPQPIGGTGVHEYELALTEGEVFPEGLSLSTAGAITGTPTKAYSGQEQHFTVKVKDTGSLETATQTYGITVARATRVAPTLTYMYNDTSITVDEVSDGLYACAVKDTPEASLVYSSERIFTGLSKSTEYDIYVKYAQNSDYLESAASKAVQRTDENPSYFVSYDSNAPTHGEVTGTVPRDVAKYIEGAQVSTQGNTGTLSNIRYNLLGWDKDKAAEVADYTLEQADAFAMGAENVTLYAIWELKSYTATFDFTGITVDEGSSVPEPISAKYNSKITLPHSTFTRAGFLHEGWQTGTGTGVDILSKYTPSGEVTILDDITYTPVWRAAAENGDTDGDGILDVDEKPGEELDQDNDGIPDIIDPDYNPDGPAPENPEKIVTVTFNANGGTPQTVTRKVEKDYFLKTAPKFTQEGHGLIGFNTASDGTGTAFVAGDADGSKNTVIPANITVYAQWKIQTNTFTFEKNGAEGTLPADITANYGAQIKMPGGADLTLQGKSFKGWSIGKTDSEAAYTPNQEVTMPEFPNGNNIILYAIFKDEVKPGAPTMTWEYNDLGAAVVTILPGADTAAEPVKAEYSTDGALWTEYNTETKLSLTTSAVLQVRSLDNGGNVSDIISETFHAVTFTHTAGGTLASPNVLIRSDNYTLQYSDIPLPTADELNSFIGWRALNTAETPVLEAVQPVGKIVTADHEYIAAFSPNDGDSTGIPPAEGSNPKLYTVTFKLDGGTSDSLQETGDETRKVAHGDNIIGVMPTGVKLAGRAFLGWTADAQAEPVVLYDTKSQILGDMTLTAVYVDGIIVTLNNNGGNSTLKNVTIGKDGSFKSMGYIELPSPGTKTGHVFDKWYTETTVDGVSTQTPVTMDTVFTEDITIHAKWLGTSSKLTDLKIEEMLGTTLKVVSADKPFDPEKTTDTLTAEVSVSQTDKFAYISLTSEQTDAVFTIKYGAGDEASAITLDLTDPESIHEGRYKIPIADVGETTKIYVSVTAASDKDGTGKRNYTLSIKSKQGGVEVKGKVKTYNPKNKTTITLTGIGANTGTNYTVDIAALATGSGQVTQDFAFPAVVPGTYTMVVSKAGHLKFTKTTLTVGIVAIDLSSTTELDLTTGVKFDARISIITLGAGDVSGDGKVDGADLNSLIAPANYGKAVPKITLTDINGDGKTDGTDLSTLIGKSSYGKSSVTIN